MISRIAVLSFAVALLTGGVAAAEQFKSGAIVVEQPWIRATPGGATIAGGYMTIVNTGKSADRLLGGSTPAAKRFEIHEMKMEAGIMKMREVTTGLELRPGQKLLLKPSGYHVMMMDLSEPLKQGDIVQGELRFEKAGAIAVKFQVESIGAQGPSPHAAPGH